VKRREFITLLGGAAAVWPLAARAQQLERMRRIGVLMVFSETDPSSQRRASALQTELAKLGWTLGRNLQIDYRWDISDDERATTAAAQLLALAPDVIIATCRDRARSTDLSSLTPKRPLDPLVGCKILVMLAMAAD
jgi:putative ABC transport system substrate-binding protein